MRLLVDKLNLIEFLASYPLADFISLLRVSFALKMHRRFQKLLFAASLVALSWYAMMAVHELGHVVGAIVTGGTIERVVLYPLTISRTDVSPNPHPAIVVWFGPVVGCILPLVVFAISLRTRWFVVLIADRCRKSDESFKTNSLCVRNIARFFAGFCLIANGAYISFGSIDRVGDCAEMLLTGTPLWVMIAFGTVTIPLGLYLWHRLGSLRQFINDPSVVTPQMAYVVSSALLVTVAAEFALSPR